MKSGGRTLHKKERFVPAVLQLKPDWKLNSAILRKQAVTHIRVHVHFDVTILPRRSVNIFDLLHGFRMRFGQSCLARHVQLLTPNFTTLILTHHLLGNLKLAK